MTGHTDGVTKWLDPLLCGVPGFSRLAAQHVYEFVEALDDLLAGQPASNDADPHARSQFLLRVRAELARIDEPAPVSPGWTLVPMLRQFICGYYDADLRDSTGLGHGRLIARHGTARLRDLWIPLLRAGALAGIAITEAHGGTQVHATATAATARADGRWELTGTKTFISRLVEAAVFVVFFKDPAGVLTAGAIDAGAAGLKRTLVTPAGLSGWTWGELHLRNAELLPDEVLGRPGQGMALLREHFAYYRPMVAATALGVAASVHDLVTAQLCARRSAGVIQDMRDNALISLGRSFGHINGAMLGALLAQRLALRGDQRGELWGCAIKAHAVDAAYLAASELTLLAGAAGFSADSRLAKALDDLRAFMFADGINDSLYRSAGRALTAGGGQPGGRPFSSDATDPEARAVRHAAIRRPTSGVTRSPTSV